MPASSRESVREVLFGEDFRWRHERHLLTVLHREHGGEDGNDRFARAHVALQQAIHRMRPLHVVADVLERLPLSAREVERKHGAQRFANAVVHLGLVDLSFRVGLASPEQQADLKSKELLEHEPLLRSRPERVQQIERRVRVRKVHLPERGQAIRKAEPLPDALGQWLIERVGQCEQRVVHEPALHLRRDRTRALVHGDDAPDVQRVGLVFVNQLEIGVGELQPERTSLQRAVQHDPLMWPQAAPSGRTS